MALKELRKTQTPKSRQKNVRNVETHANIFMQLSLLGISESDDNDTIHENVKLSLC